MEQLPKHAFDGGRNRSSITHRFLDTLPLALWVLPSWLLGAKRESTNVAQNDKEAIKILQVKKRQTKVKPAG